MFSVCCQPVQSLAPKTRADRRSIDPGAQLSAARFRVHSVKRRFEEARDAGLIAQLDILEMHYLYVVAVLPKIAENLFGELAQGLDRSYILWFNSLADVIVLLVLASRRLLTSRSDLIFFCTVGGAIVAVSLVVQPRYFYFIYALLCLQAAQRRRRPGGGARVLGQPAAMDHPGSATALTPILHTLNLSRLLRGSRQVKRCCLTGFSFETDEVAPFISMQLPLNAPLQFPC